MPDVTTTDASEMVDPYKRDPAEMNPKEYDFKDLIAAVANASEIAKILMDDVLYDRVVRPLSLVVTHLDDARHWAREGSELFVKPPVE